MAKLTYTQKYNVIVSIREEFTDTNPTATDLWRHIKLQETGYVTPGCFKSIVTLLGRKFSELKAPNDDGIEINRA